MALVLGRGPTDGTSRTGRDWWVVVCYRCDSADPASVFSMVQERAGVNRRHWILRTRKALSQTGRRGPESFAWRSCMNRIRVLSGLVLTSSIGFCISCSSNSGSSTTAAKAQGTLTPAPLCKLRRSCPRDLPSRCDCRENCSRMKLSLSTRKLPPSWIRFAWIGDRL